MIPRPNPKAVDRKRRLALPAADLPIREPGERLRDFEEAYANWDLATAMAEAERCIQCPSAPCVKACPAGSDIPYALWLLEHGDVAGAASVFRDTNIMPEICGRVCPQSALCEGVCPYAKQRCPPVPIGRLEAFVADRMPVSAAERAAPTGHRAAIVGAGPAGLTVAEVLSSRGHEVTVFDAWPAAGGVLRYGIPTFKMTHGLVRERTERLDRLGVSFVPGTFVGRDVTVDDLFDSGFETVFLGTGAGVERAPSFPGSELQGVLRATPFLVRANVEAALRPAGLAEPPDIGRRVAVIGGGDTAMDCARTALRLGAQEVTCWYRRTEEQMPGNVRDRSLAREEGTRFRWLSQPERFTSGPDGRLQAMDCLEMELGEPDTSDRPRPVPVASSGFTVEVDTAILALGYEPDRAAVGAVPHLVVDEKGRISIDSETGATSRDGVFAGGDSVLGPALVVHAVVQGRAAAEAMHRHLVGDPVAPTEPAWKH
jgi:glutamate synthase (NADPH/NADH) small chain